MLKHDGSVSLPHRLKAFIFSLINPTTSLFCCHGKVVYVVHTPDESFCMRDRVDRKHAENAQTEMKHVSVICLQVE